MKRILILTFLLSLCADCLAQQDPVQVVRTYITTLNDALSSPNDMTRRRKIENLLGAGSPGIKDEIVEKYNTKSTSRMLSGPYLAIFYDLIQNSSTAWIKVSIIGTPTVRDDRGVIKVCAFLQYSGAISLKTSSEFWVNGSNITGIMSDEVGIAEISRNGGNTPDPPKPTVPFTITSCTVSNVDSDGNTLPFDAAHTQYLKPEIRYTCNTAGSYDIYVKFYDANGSLSTGSSSPSGYSYKYAVSMSSGDGRAKLSGYGSNTSGPWQAGSYRFEFYYNGTKLKTCPFSVPEGTPTSGGGSGGTSGSHQYVDLGLPSGTLWATCNVGANNPWDYGDYFAWGETSPTPKPKYDWSTYKYANGAYDKLTKYCTKSSYGNNDKKKQLDPSDDAAAANWGSDWCMPTQAQFQELKEECTWTWTTRNGKNGYEVKGPNNKSIFLPAAGYKDSDGKTSYVGSNGNFWSSSLDAGSPSDARGLSFYSGGVYTYSGYRYFGNSVRPVRCSN